MADVEWDATVKGDAAEKFDGIAHSADHAADEVEKLDVRLKTVGQLKIDADIAGVQEKLARLRAELDKATGTKHIKIEADIAVAEAELQALQRTANTTGEQVKGGAMGGAQAWMGVAAAVAAGSSEIVGLGAVAIVGGITMVAAFHGVSDAVALLNQRTGEATDQQRQLAAQIDAQFKQMSTGGQAFALELSSLEQGPLKQLQISAQDGFLRGLTSGLKDAEQPLRELSPLVADFSTHLGQLLGPMIPQVVKLGDSIVHFADASLQGLQKAGLGKAFEDLSTNLGKMFDELASSGEAEQAMKAVVDVIEILAKDGPPLLELLLRISADFAGIADSAAAVAAPIGKILDLFAAIDKYSGGFVGKVIAGALGGGGLGGLASAAGMADGGTATSGGLSWVGEDGPELMSVPTGASVIPLPRLGEMGGGSVTNNYNISGVIGPAASVVTALRSANVATRRRGYGAGIQ